MAKRTRFSRDKNELHELDPTRRPDWRFQRALKLAAHKRPRRYAARDDDDVRTMTLLLLRLRHGNESRREELAAELAGPVQALAIFEGSDLDFRVRLECEILAGQSDDEIAELLGISTVCVTAYERSFFDVRSRLECRDWICSCAINGMGSPTVQREIKALAYHSGPAVLRGVPGSNAADNWEACKLVAQYMASLNHLSPLQLLELHRELAAERRANQAVEAFNVTVADAARELIAAACPNAGEQNPPDAEPADVWRAA